MRPFDCNEETDGGSVGDLVYVWTGVAVGAVVGLSVMRGTGISLGSTVGALGISLGSTVGAGVVVGFADVDGVDNVVGSSVGTLLYVGP
jgi:hypothetical protein